MSRTRIVKGNITKITGGNYKVYSKDNIVNSGSKVIQKGKSDGVSYGTPTTPPPSPVTAKCLVFFRPTNAWEGEFGFDWVRVNDSHLAVDNRYNGIIGSYGAVYASESGAVFTPSAADYRSILNQYNNFGTYKGQYYVPNMTLLSGDTAILDAVVHIEEKADSMQYIYNTDVFELTILKQFTVAVGVNHDDSCVRIKCKKMFNATESIRVMATKNGQTSKVGEIKVLPNNNVKNIDILMIPVSVEKMNATGAVKGNEKVLTRNAMKQSYLNANISEKTSPTVMGGFFFNLFFTTTDSAGNVVMDLSRWRSIHSALESAFFDNPANSIYRNHYRVYMMPNSLSLNGVAEDIGNTKVVAAFGNRNDSSTAHELMHAMGLYHTFDNDSQFTFEYRKTDNIMDYTHQIRKKRFSTNKFQWKILNRSVS